MPRRRAGQKDLHDLPSYGHRITVGRTGDRHRKRDSAEVPGFHDTAAAGGAIRDDISASDLLFAIAHLCLPVPGEGTEYSRRMMGVLIGGLRNGPQRQS